MYNTLLINKTDGIETIIINRPKSNNSFNELLLKELLNAIECCNSDTDVQVVIITGSGKNFSSGGDINEMATFNFLSYDLSTLSGKMTGAVRKCSKPVIAMINGSAAGAGCALALACDFRIMAEKSVLLTAFSNVGLSGDSGCIYHLYHIVGLAKTIELMMLSRPIRGEEALSLGLATSLVEEEGLESATLRFAKELKCRPLSTFAKQKEVYFNTFYRDYDEYCKLEAQMLTESSKTNDHQEAVMAFLEKRKPIFNKNSKI